MFERVQRYSTVIMNYITRRKSVYDDDVKLDIPQPLKFDTGITYLMGHTGSGKSLLLSYMVNKISNYFTIEGNMEVDVDGDKIDPKDIIAYIPQSNDLLPHNMTIRSYLRRECELYSLYSKEITEKVDEVFEMVEIETHADCVIGSPGDGINVE